MQFDRDAIDAVIFDLDGVLTNTAEPHATAWKETFDELLARHAGSAGAGDDSRFRPFDLPDYRRYVDGKSREDGITAFLRSRGIELESGSPKDSATEETVHGIGARKNERFHELVAARGVTPFASSVALVRALRRAGVRTAVISASRNCAAILRAAAIDGLFDTKVDGVDAAELGLPGKPDPAIFREATKRLGADPQRTAIVEDSLAGVKAGARGGFALVIGVARDGDPEELRRRGAHAVVSDLAEIEIAGGTPPLG